MKESVDLVIIAARTPLAQLPAWLTRIKYR